MSVTVPVSIPHWAFPFAFNAQQGVSAVEQGSLQEIQSNVVMIISCPVNTCPEIPSFGIPDPTFQGAPPSPDAIVAAVQQIEPRALESVVVSALDTSQADWQMSFTTGVAGTGQ